MVKAILKRVGIWSLAKFQAIAMGVIGLMLGILLAVAITISGYIATDMISSNLGGNSITGGYDVGSLVNVAGIQAGFTTAAMYTLIATPILFALMGLISGFITALLYNLVARISSGIKMDLDEIEEEQK
jgi:ABC-type sulfate transport system permease subunit